MTKNNYTIIENTQKSIYKNCVFCFERNPADFIIKTRKISNNRLLDYDGTCLNCRDKFNNNELEKCLNCERLIKYEQIKCKCEIFDDENTDEEDDKGDRETIQLEKQVQKLSLEKEQLEEDVDIHLSALGTAEQWGKMKADQELVEENKKLKEEIAKLTKMLEQSQALIAEIHQYPK